MFQPVYLLLRFSHPGGVGAVQLHREENTTALSRGRSGEVRHRRVGLDRFSVEEDRWENWLLQ